MLQFLLPLMLVTAQAPAEYAVLAQRCRKLLDTSVISFFLPGCIDTVHGGYYENWKDGKFIHTGEKFLTQQARDLWFFSTLARHNVRHDDAFRAAKAGFDFLQKHFRDSQHAGYFSKVKDNGEVSDARKHAYLNSFALYALAAYYQSSQDPAALKAAQELFAILEAKAYDRQHGGYREFFSRDWMELTDPKEGGYVGPVQTKTYNTHLHLLEALTALYRVWPDPLVGQRLAELIQINTLTVRHHELFFNIDQWTNDWKAATSNGNARRVSYGHDIECAWLVLDACRALKRPMGTLYRWADQLVNFSIDHGYDRTCGGFYYAGSERQPAFDTKKEWWVQAEALVSMMEMHRITGGKEYMQLFQQTLDFIENHHLAPGGGWYATLQADGKVISDNRATMWQGPYHTGRALLYSALMLEELAKGKTP
ncbi:MAG TPA: AGE family epimerase/isomerase [Gemmatales bacterium]|nr:AGE family epimerase/isomerase [Gemmatales bacterium]